MSYAKSLREETARLSVDMHAIINAAKAENNRGLSSEEREKFHALETAYSNLEESIKLAERADTISNDLRTVDRDRLIDEFPADKSKENDEKNAKLHNGAFSKYLRAGMESLNSEERQFMARNFIANGNGPVPAVRNTMSTTTGSQGGYIIPQGFSGMLEEAKLWFGGIDNSVEKFSTATGNPFPWPTLNDTSNKGRIIGQNVPVTEADLAFGQVTFNAYIGSSDLVLVPLALMEDSYFNLDALIAKLLGTRLGRLYNNKCTVGSGTNEPTGIVVAATTASSVNTFPTGETTTITYSDLVNIEHTVDPAYRNNPASMWMFSDTVLKILKKLVDGQNRPLWQPGLTASFGNGAGVTAGKPSILDHPYVINQDMAVPAANAYSVLFGDMSAYKVRELTGGTTVLRLVERYADYLQVGFIAYQRFDGNLIDAGTHPIALGRNSAT